MMGNKNVTQHVIDKVRSAATYMNRHVNKTKIRVSVYLLIPERDSDAIIESVDLYGVKLVTGPEQDVLSRYAVLMDKYSPDYLVRITGDCPLIPSPVIVKTVNLCVKGEYDFVTNASPEYRTFFDGADCEMVNARLFEWVNRNAEGSDREHVMSILYNNKPAWCNHAHLFSNFDMTKTKLSVDTEEDLLRAEEAYESVERKIQSWVEKNGKQTCHRY